MSSAPTAAPGRPLPPLSLPVLAVVALTAIVGVAVAVAIAPAAWAVDIDRNLRAADALRAGSFRTIEGYLYTPLAAALTVPLAVVPAGVAVAGWLAVRLALIMAGVRRETAGRAIGDRAAAALGAVTFIPTLHDLMLGNVSVVITATLALLLWWRDRWWTGIALGLVLATFPKPQLIPILVWMLVFRRRSLLGALGTAAIATGVGVLWLGFERYLTFVDVVLHVPYLETPMYGNLGLTGLTPDLVVPLGMLTVAAAAIGLWRGEVAGFICAVGAGILLAPYTMAYSAVPLLLGVRPLSRVAPRTTFALALTGSLGVLVFLPLWVGAVMAVALGVPRLRWARAEREPATIRAP